jgi:hypothetical protein
MDTYEKFDIISDEVSKAKAALSAIWTALQNLEEYDQRIDGHELRKTYREIEGFNYWLENDLYNVLETIAYHFIARPKGNP